MDLIFNFTRGNSIRTLELNKELMEQFLTGESCTDSVEGSSHGGTLCSGAPQGELSRIRLHLRSGTPANWEEHLSPLKTIYEDLEVLAENDGNLALKSRKKNRSGAAKKQARKVGSQRFLLGSAGQTQQGSRLGAARPGPCRCPNPT